MKQVARNILRKSLPCILNNKVEIKVFYSVKNSTQDILNFIWNILSPIRRKPSI